MPKAHWQTHLPAGQLWIKLASNILRQHARRDSDHHDNLTFVILGAADKIRESVKK
jgi:hypothetical protein